MSHFTCLVILSPAEIASAGEDMEGVVAARLRRTCASGSRRRSPRVRRHLALGPGDRVADAWAGENERLGTPLLAHLLGSGDRPATPSERDIAVASTVVQWLGSPVGQGFLRDLGYERHTRR